MNSLPLYLCFKYNYKCIVHCIFAAHLRPPHPISCAIPELMPNQLSAFREAEGAAGQTELTTISGLKSNMWHRCMNALETNMMHEMLLFM